MSEANEQANLELNTDLRAVIGVNRYTLRAVIADLEAHMGATNAFPVTSLLVQAREKLQAMAGGAR